MVDPGDSVADEAPVSTPKDSQSAQEAGKAADKALDLISRTYLDLLGLPFGVERIRVQRTLNALRDYIAQGTGRDTEAVQHDYEAIAAFAKAQGL